MSANLKVSCNTSISAQLINDAKELKLSPSAILEEALSKAVKVAKYERWQQENKQAIAEHNRRVEEQGTFSEKIRQL
ncbi:type II toxin-antitoxin system CcdA family antitoxin [uncultured Paraglaciecola sp.]|uniref:type II toxin-antitoxin system CcdA family antitoxin n=1 Tax=uncultured Paraglaciecola sp. TaxID=1765024 RepID=UPI0030DB378C